MKTSSPKLPDTTVRLGSVGRNSLSPTSVTSNPLNSTNYAQNSTNQVQNNTNHSQNGHNNNENAKPNVPDSGGCVLDVYVVLLITSVITLLEA